MEDEKRLYYYFSEVLIPAITLYSFLPERKLCSALLSLSLSSRRLILDESCKRGSVNVKFCMDIMFYRSKLMSWTSLEKRKKKRKGNYTLHSVLSILIHLTH